MIRRLGFYLFIFLQLVLVDHGVGQASLKDTTAVLDFKNKGLSYYPRDIDSVYYNFDLAINLARDIGYHRGEADILRSRGAIKGFNGDLDGGLVDLEAAKNIIRDYNLGAEALVNCFINQGVVYDGAVQLALSIEQYIEGERIARENNLTAKRTLLLNNLGVAYRKLGRYDESIRIYQEALVVRQELKDTAGVATLLMNMSGAASRLRDTTLSLDYGSQAIELYQKVGSKADILYAQSNYGHVLSGFGFYSEAIEFLEKVNEEDLSEMDLHQQFIVTQALAFAYEGSGDHIRSERIYRSFESELEETGFQEIKRETYLSRARNNKALGEDRRAYEMLDKHLALLEEYNEEETIKARQEMESKYLAVEKDLKIELQNSKLDRVNRERWFYIVGLLGLIALAGLLWRLSRIRKKSNQELDEKNVIISKSLKEKDLLLREIHHRVKNNLQFISSLLRLQSDHVTDPTALGALQQGHDRVRSMALIHQDLYKEDNLTGVDTKTYFEKLITGLFKSNNIHGDRIKLSIDVERLNLDVDTIVPIGLITNELITNSLKYAFPDQKKGTVSVRLQEINNHLILDIQDDGVGMSGNQEGKLGDSFGYKLIHALVGQLDGTISIKKEKGTSVNISLKRYEVV